MCIDDVDDVFGLCSFGRESRFACDDQAPESMSVFRSAVPFSYTSAHRFPEAQPLRAPLPTGACRHTSTYVADSADRDHRRQPPVTGGLGGRASRSSFPVCVYVCCAVTSPRLCVPGAGFSEENSDCENCGTMARPRRTPAKVVTNITPFRFAVCGESCSLFGRRL